MPRPSLLACLALAVAAATTPGCAKMLRGYAATESDAVRLPPPGSAQWSDAEWGGFYVLYGDFGSLTTDNLATNAVPWKLVTSMPDVVPEPFFAGGRFGWRPAPGEPLRRFGVVYGATLAGPPGLTQVIRAGAWTDVPVGYARGTVQRSLPDLTLDLASTNCSMCHLGRGWDAGGQPTNRVWWGIPNHSIDFDGLIAAITAAMLDPRATDEALIAAMQRRYPEMGEAEIATYRKYVLPAFKKAIREAKARWGSLHPWRFGGPGFSHGVALLRDALASDKAALGPGDFPAAFVKIPNLYGVTEKRWLLIDGSYEAARRGTERSRFVDHLVGFLPVFGTSIERSVEEAPRLDKVVAFLSTLQPPPFPGPVDAAAAARGAVVYGERCSYCHGDRAPDGAYRYPSVRTPVAEIGTDPTRGRALDADLARRFEETEIGRFEHFRATGAYMPPPLHGVWASAPYFHNGSVPTLWHVLTPDARPRRFLTGGHPYDFKRVGVACTPDRARAGPGSVLLATLGEPVCAYPAGYVPWSEPSVYDTTEPGRGNQGHEAPSSGLSDAVKWDLLEYLKTL
jgi:mono/diheme cytochrome c family protein